MRARRLTSLANQPQPSSLSKAFVEPTSARYLFFLRKLIVLIILSDDVEQTLWGFFRLFLFDSGPTTGRPPKLNKEIKI